jgi:hypothetical protein
MVKLPIDEDFTPHMSFSVNRSLLAYVEPDDYVLTVHGRICSDDDREIARLLAYIIQVNRALNEEQDLFEACDAHSQTVTDYYEALFDHETGDFKESIEEQLGTPHLGNILILDRIEVLPAFRKCGVGLAAACRFIDTFSNDVDDLLVGLPHPLQFTNSGRPADAEWKMKMKYQNLPRDKRKSTKKLQAYWSKLGMQRLQDIEIDGSPVYGLSLSNKRPTLADLGIK